MSILDFIKDRATVIIINILSMVLLSVYLLVIKTDPMAIAFILIIWFVILISYGTLNFYIKKKYFDHLNQMINSLEQKYLITEVMEEPYSLEGLMYYEVMRKATKSMIEKITLTRNECEDYKEYIEEWIHEIKNPIAAIKLMCENDCAGSFKKVDTEMEKIDHFVEQVLFYARSENLEKDYLIKEFPILEVVNAAIIKNKQLLQGSMSIAVAEITETVYSDPKWIEFILNQLIQNSVKYKKANNAILKIYSERQSSGVYLIIEDNGIGIYESDLSRVFDKGFTGINGRIVNKSTGLGLYLCKRMCDKLGHVITISSNVNQYTRVTIFFPKGTFTKMQD